MSPDRIAELVRADNLYFVTDPIGGQIYSTTVPTRFHPFFDHFFAVYFKFNLAIGKIDARSVIICGTLVAVLAFILWHVDLPLFVTKFWFPQRCDVGVNAITQSYIYVHPNRGLTLVGIPAVYLKCEYG